MTARTRQHVITPPSRWPLIARVVPLSITLIVGGALIAGCDPGQYGIPGSTRAGQASSLPTAGAHPTTGPSTAHTPTTTPGPTTQPASTTTATPTTHPTTTPPTSTPPTSSPAPSAPPSGGFPNASNTGVPAGTALSDYRGSCTITADGTVIDAMTVTCNLDIRAANVMIKRSKINGRVILDTDIAGSSRWSYTLQDSEVNGGVAQLPAVSYGNMSVIRSNVYGGETAVQCGEKASFCTVRDSWLHGQNIPAGANWHLGGFLSNGGTNVLLQHNSVICDAAPTGSDGGCTGDINLFGDFAVVSHVSVLNNLMGANTGSAYCTFGGDVSNKPFPHANNVVYQDNVFVRGSNSKCGTYGPVSNFNVNGPGNKWINNTWQDGTPVQPAM